MYQNCFVSEKKFILNTQKYFFFKSLKTYEVLMDKILDFDKGENLYDVLGCGYSASKEQITTEYRLLVKKLHPDKNIESRGDSKCYEK